MGRDRAQRPSTGGGALAFQDPLPVSRSTVATPRAARAADFISDKFKLWFGKSKLKYKDTKRPVLFFHGSKSFGITDPATGPDGNWSFNDERLGKNTGSPVTALGHFFTRDRNEAMGCPRGTQRPRFLPAADKAGDR